MAKSVLQNISEFVLGLWFIAASAPAFAQATLQAGPWTAGHIPVYANPGSSQAIFLDSAKYGILPKIAANACGTVILGSIAGSDVSGTLNIGTGIGNVTSCVVTFTTPHPGAPSQCQLTSENATAANWTATGAYISALAMTGFTITGINLSGAQYGYFCL